MSTRREAIKNEKRRRKARQKWVTYISIGLVILGVAALIWIIIASQPPKAVTSQSAPTVQALQFATPPPMQIDVKKQYFRDC